MKEHKELSEFDRKYLKEGYTAIAGMDEAGRGPLAGPVVTACVVMPLEEDMLIVGVNDSKKLTEKNRERLYKKIVAAAKEYTVSVVDESVIDEVNILEATKMGMRDCVSRIKGADLILTDAVKIESEITLIPMIHGDALSYSIAAASIIAKVTRDRIMREFAEIYPQYGFERHKGYGTAEHIRAIKEWGPWSDTSEEFYRTDYREWRKIAGPKEKKEKKRQRKYCGRRATKYLNVIIRRAMENSI